ncbi:hypothetical protein AAFF_G00323080 [Aldrovandia affinis]|uniref:Uncharacterized protein n=1 Tax=Aldrovandia affinis TaxID=143900 RepID=A0AAD7SMC2_9TELE|nr:hypothetical protein AAFF_G00323080 [Aldrovandia affinis]
MADSNGRKWPVGIPSPKQCRAFTLLRERGEMDESRQAVTGDFNSAGGGVTLALVASGQARHSEGPESTDVS